jgi:hypothetical protein
MRVEENRSDVDSHSKNGGRSIDHRASCLFPKTFFRPANHFQARRFFDGKIFSVPTSSSGPTENKKNLNNRRDLASALKGSLT